MNVEEKKRLQERINPILRSYYIENQGLEHVFLDGLRNLTNGVFLFACYPTTEKMACVTIFSFTGNGNNITRTGCAIKPDVITHLKNPQTQNKQIVMEFVEAVVTAQIMYLVSLQANPTYNCRN